MPLLLRTFGTLELLDESGTPLLGAAAQRLPLLILALAALHPEGMPRERLLKALWPGVAKVRARAVLKQHLYALRRDTGRPLLVGGTPRLKADLGEVRVDAWEFTGHIRHGRIGEAIDLLRGDLLEALSPEDGSELAHLLGEVRERFASDMAMVQ
ncbi:MAG: hypothetical protein HOP28_01160, partial [Gemmatimonadales bacterium]|nr:hypothetical protein [Gemmatimonadales bacterium]